MILNNVAEDGTLTFCHPFKKDHTCEFQVHPAALKEGEDAGCLQTPPMKCITGCGEEASTTFPITGDSNAQTVHAHFRVHSKMHPAETLDQAADAVAMDIEK